MNGAYKTVKLDGSTYFRASITHKNKHISLGSSPSESAASSMYIAASEVLKGRLGIEDYSDNNILNFSVWVTLINFRDNNVYFKTPIYLRKKYFLYYFSPEIVFKFDTDDLFFYSQHRIQARGKHFFCENYGAQVSLSSRYGIRPFAVKDRDYRFLNGDDTDYRYENIEIINKYYGVEKIIKKFDTLYKAKIHVNGNYSLGTFKSEDTAAIAVNKAIDLLSRTSLKKKRMYSNFIEHIPASSYADIYSSIILPKKFMELIRSHLAE
ncbi:MAG: hypothetical protein K6G84_11080 [Lachnospiraceae bacterium]|nr:hypothetical protein [Lachnospiraceae bacterium]